MNPSSEPRGILSAGSFLTLRPFYLVVVLLVDSTRVITYRKGTNLLETFLRSGFESMFYVVNGRLPIDALEWVERGGVGDSVRGKRILYVDEAEPIFKQYSSMYIFFSSHASRQSQLEMLPDAAYKLVSVQHTDEFPSISIDQCVVPSEDQLSVISSLPPQTPYPQQRHDLFGTFHSPNPDLVLFGYEHDHLEPPSILTNSGRTTPVSSNDRTWLPDVGHQQPFPLTYAIPLPLKLRRSSYTLDISSSSTIHPGIHRAATRLLAGLAELGANSNMNTPELDHQSNQLNSVIDSMFGQHDQVVARKGTVTLDVQM